MSCTPCSAEQQQNRHLDYLATTATRVQHSTHTSHRFNPLMPTAAPLYYRHHFDSQTPDFGQNDTQMYFVRFSVFVESKEIFHKFHS